MSKLRPLNQFIPTKTELIVIEFCIMQYMNYKFYSICPPLLKVEPNLMSIVLEDFGLAPRSTLSSASPSEYPQLGSRSSLHKIRFQK